ncbi:hypothetical protein ACFC08_28570 [Streptomyces sp. NPDC056112]|uniref:hypothetical protein n=1 Tax=Streptomyces sp. NPDC056112 TaxID=3345715 RepID=UPI0035D872AB
MTTATDYPPGIKSAATRLNITPAEYLAKKNAGLKWCRACNDWQPLTDYKPSTSTRDGVRPLCTRHYNPRQPVPIPHGRIGGYRRGCRCPQCRQANTAAVTRSKAKRAKDPTAADRAGHGKATTYGNYGCRCAPCKAAQSRRNAFYFQRRQARQKGPIQ